VEVGLFRYVRASMRVGPPPPRALSTPAFVTAYTASKSFPSTRTPSIPYARAFSAIVLAAVCFATGTEMAHWLFLQKKIVEALKTPAKFIPAWKSPSLVAPSPKNVRLTTSSWRIFAAHAAPTACVICVPTGLEVVTRTRSEEHTSELQSRSDLVCRLLLEKKNNVVRHLPRILCLSLTTPPYQDITSLFFIYPSLKTNYDQSVDTCN